MRRKPVGVWLPRSVSLLLVGLMVSGCAVANRDNTLLLNKLDETVRPRKTAERVALAPIMIPTATGALAVDGLVIHPARVLPQAAEDVDELYWRPRDETLLRRSLLFMPRVILTPPTFLGAWYVRATFDIPDRSEDSK